MYGENLSLYSSVKFTTIFRMFGDELGTAALGNLSNIIDRNF